MKYTLQKMARLWCSLI